MRFLHHLFPSPSQDKPIGAPLHHNPFSGLYLARDAVRHGPQGVDRHRNLRSRLYLAQAVTLLRQGLLLVRAPHALRWRLETFGLYMPSLPESRPWWRVNAAALGALLDQLPGYMRWLYQMHLLRRGGARELWRLQAHGDAAAWEAWLALSEDEADGYSASVMALGCMNSFT